MSFSQFGSNATISDIIRERRNDAAIVNNLKQYKRDSRDMTPTRAIPSSNSDIIAGDKEGDEVCDGTHLYQLRNLSGTLGWVKINVTSSF